MAEGISTGGERGCINKDMNVKKNMMVAMMEVAKTKKLGTTITAGKVALVVIVKMEIVIEDEAAV